MRFAAQAFLVLLAAAACGPTSSTKAVAQQKSADLQDGTRLSSPRATHALVRLGDGRLLAIGGCVAAGCEAGPGSGTIDVISPDGRSLLGTSRMIQARVQPSAIVLADGRVLILGGWVNGRVSAATELYDPATGRSHPGPELPGGRAMPTLVSLSDGRILIAGGNDGSGVVADAFLFDPAQSKLRAVASLNDPRAGATGTRLNDGRILIVGGGDSESRNRHALASAEIFDPESERFVITGSLHQRRYKHGAVVLPSGDVLVIGGSDERDYDGKLRSVERYDPQRGTFSKAGTLVAARFKLADAVVLVDQNHVLVAGGDTSPELFDVTSGRSERLAADLGSNWNYLTAAITRDGAILLAGGYSEGTIRPTDRTWLLRKPALS